MRCLLCLFLFSSRRRCPFSCCLSLHSRSTAYAFCAHDSSSGRNVQQLTGPPSAISSDRRATCQLHGHTHSNWSMQRIIWQKHELSFIDQSKSSMVGDMNCLDKSWRKLGIIDHNQRERVIRRDRNVHSCDCLTLCQSIAAALLTGVAHSRAKTTNNPESFFLSRIYVSFSCFLSAYLAWMNY